MLSGMLVFSCTKIELDAQKVKALVAASNVYVRTTYYGKKVEKVKCEE